MTINRLAMSFWDMCQLPLPKLLLELLQLLLELRQPLLELLLVLLAEFPLLEKHMFSPCMVSYNTLLVCNKLVG